MKITGLIWLDDIIDKLARKHAVQMHEAQEVLSSHAHIRFVEKGRRVGEDLYAAYGRTDAGRNLAVFFVYKKTKEALVVSARDMTKSERRSYGKA